MTACLAAGSASAAPARPARNGTAGGAGTAAARGALLCGPPDYFIQCYSPGQYQVAYGVAPLLRGEAEGPDWAERVIVTDTQRVPEPIKWRLSCVMQGDWRLVNRDELYDLVTDPNQRTNLAAEHPAMVAGLRDAYESWWDLCTRQAGADIPISIGAVARETAELRTHDLRNADGDVVWHQGQVRAGQACLGYWEVMVERAGLYEFSLRRWPAEAGHAIRAGIDGDDIAFRRDAIAEADWGMYTGGKPLEIDGAHLEATGYPPQRVAVADEVAAVLRIGLDAGSTHIRAWFSGAAGLMQSPYYVCVRRCNEVGTR